MTTSQQNADPFANLVSSIPAPALDSFGFDLAPPVSSYAAPVVVEESRKDDFGFDDFGSSPAKNNAAAVDAFSMDFGNLMSKPAAAANPSNDAIGTSNNDFDLGASTNVNASSNAYDYNAGSGAGASGQQSYTNNNDDFGYQNDYNTNNYNADGGVDNYGYNQSTNAAGSGYDDYNYGAGASNNYSAADNFDNYYGGNSGSYNNNDYYGSSSHDMGSAADAGGDSGFNETDAELARYLAERKAEENKAA